MRIAVLEDDPGFLSLMESVIERLGHVCVSFSDGMQIFKNLQRGSYDLLILDWHVPRMSGMEILLWLRQKKEDRTPVAFVTSAAFESEIVAALRQGADDYIIKPIERDEHRRHDRHEREKTSCDVLHCLLSSVSYR